MGNRKNKVKKMKMNKDCIAKLSSPVVMPSTVSATQLQFNDSVSDFDSSDEEPEFDVAGSGYRLWECDQLQTLISQSCVCKTYGESVEIVEDYDKHKGWCSKVAS